MDVCRSRLGVEGEYDGQGGNAWPAVCGQGRAKITGRELVIVVYVV